MNSTDLHILLEAPPVSRTAFFTQLLAAPDAGPQHETPLDDRPTDSAVEPTSSAAAPAQSPVTDFPA